jgi:hypothetical protein
MKAARKSQPSFPAEEILPMADASMRAQFVVSRTMGKTRAATPEEFFGFKAADVIDLHFHKRGFGGGVWYRLKDGRVIDAQGRRSRRARSWYSARAH